MGKAQRTKPRQRWKAACARWRGRWRAVCGAAAAAAGHLLRVLPGTAGPLLVAYGLWLAWEPLGYAGLGLFLWLADRRIP